MDSIATANNDEFVASQLSFDQASGSGTGGGGNPSAVDGGMLMSLSREAERMSKADRKRKRAERKQEKAQKAVLEQALKAAATADPDIDPSLQDAPVMIPQVEAEAEPEAEAEAEAEQPAKKKKKKRAKKAAAVPEPNDDVPMPEVGNEEGAGPSEAGPSKRSNAKPAKGMVNKFGKPTNSLARPDRKKHAADEDELRAQFAMPGAMHAYLAERWMTTVELRKLEAAGVISYKKGKFSDEEEQAIRKAVEFFRQSNGLTETQLTDLIMSKKEKSNEYPGFYSDLAAAVTGRPVRFVQKYVKRLYDTRARKGKWSEQEDDELLQAYNSNSGSWVKIALAVDRPEEDCRARWRDVLRSKSGRDEGRWTKEEETQLVEAIKEANLALGKEATARDPPWEVVTTKMDDKRTQMQCRKKWHSKLWPELQGAQVPAVRVRIGQSGDGKEEALKVSAADRVTLVRLIKELDVDTISAIDWDGLATEHWPELGPGPLSKAFKRMMGKAGVGKNMATPLSEVLSAIEKSLSKEKAATFKSPKRVPDNADD
ncbi:uncharacterized protein MKK02DRAFT_27995 [Dioszegia hungarica]|uniref:Uncharacterized protein n=1 Tax=Dioszegia hungarica TaxID=4972 RepID=A0AA38H742_9TREE|nr:uncharacterized protein MKK02DRAFT_27995 [Dioszegia hungarica]KAI9634866.1 hypothetical protein MKK02DRAFT_27995 [Dioszegia hungarica]